MLDLFSGAGGAGAGYARAGFENVVDAPLEGFILCGAALGLTLSRQEIPWMTRDELAQAIPPAYTEWIGTQLLSALPYIPPEEGSE